MSYVEVKFKMHHVDYEDAIATMSDDWEDLVEVIEAAGGYDIEVEPVLDVPEKKYISGPPKPKKGG